MENAYDVGRKTSFSNVYERNKSFQTHDEIETNAIASEEKESKHVDQ